MSESTFKEGVPYRRLARGAHGALVDGAVHEVAKVRREVALREGSDRRVVERRCDEVRCCHLRSDQRAENLVWGQEVSESAAGREDETYISPARLAGASQSHRLPQKMSSTE